ncbi:GNAT family N-acetyltransferase [Streptomyces europaeiscabiei]|uniref:GNAT family N-acetyltransferase n=1 Tax=Streptomyces europaeiscabiei TaxID=146819 RepID=UPI000628587E|nr:GNAT family N-acetyltransferase [Streptomyces europaeiscabiei]MDX2764223.1 GNAT family N-acetyltransferase [Streptomyces europaeiscabiei]MDX2773833.1 GNAT family N-acetyltransferase [Streptomyces europaeiscabiei]MDX3668951.1 GNAT family N-acetyltransferase [Streptomyces europaeiscabiei]MDX3831959.1 GNAT family N-acetyltransferase [Streptomyces europaeiscabiei]MDX3863613.1 GNAT family N-acetyltransferase [Streptomyces europaeiscabiei]
MTSTLHTGPRTTLRAELCTDESEFAELAGPWDRLYRRCGAATPFQSHAWLHSWWLSYGTPGRLRLVLVRDGAELRAVAPLLLVRSPVPALVPLGCPISDFADVIVDDEYADEASDALAEGLSAAARTALIDFREVRPGAAVEQIYDRWRGPRRKVADSVCLELPAQPMDELLKRLPNSRAQRVRAKLRKLGDLGIEPRAVRADEVDSALRTMLDLHRLQWQDRKVTTEHMRPRFSEHLARSVEPMVRSGDAVVTEFRLGGDVLAVDVTLLSRRLAGGYLYGAHPRLRERKADVATMLLNACAGQVSAGSHQVLSLLRGAEPYKLRWRPDTVVNQRLLLARRRTAPLLSAVAYDAAARLRGKELIRRWRARKDPEQNRDRGEQPERKEPGGGGR